MDTMFEGTYLQEFMSSINNSPKQVGKHNRQNSVGSAGGDLTLGDYSSKE
jgi:hypothetical protein